MGVSWTKEQAQVIHLRNRNILVSAAAGSGKTAVLVERIITRLTVDEPPIDVDQMLVVTFTEAAAAEMKERIRDAIEKKLEEQPENVHLQRQATLIHNAQVTTIHSFCLSVIRDYFHMIDLDPGFRIADEGELKLLRQDVLEEVLENCYTAGEQSFLDCIESFAAGRDDKKIEEIILQLYEFSRSNPEPEKWLRQCVKSYEVDTMEAFEASEGAVYAKESLRKALEETMALLEKGIRQCQEPDGPYMYADALKEDRERIQKLLAQTTMRGMYDLFADWKWKRFAANKDKSVSEELTALVKNIREEVKDIVGALKDQFFYEAPEELGRLAKSIAGLKNERVMKRFQKKYEQLRRSLTEAGGVREIIAKHLEKRNAKVIVFCPRIAKLREFMLLRREWFGAVNSEIHAYKTVSTDPYGSEDFQAFKDDESDALKVLYCVNQLNEAVHVKGVDAIVMVRPTKSPTVFYQQLGRVLSSGGNRIPLVFDFCNNFGSIAVAEEIPKRMEKAFKSRTDEGEQLPFTPSDFQIIDNTLTFKQLTDEIRKSLQQRSRVEEKIAFLEQIAQANGGRL